MKNALLRWCVCLPCSYWVYFLYLSFLPTRKELFLLAGKVVEEDRSVLWSRLLQRTGRTAGQWGGWVGALGKLSPVLPGASTSPSAMTCVAWWTPRSAPPSTGRSARWCLRSSARWWMSLSAPLCMSPSAPQSVRGSAPQVRALSTSSPHSCACSV